MAFAIRQLQTVTDGTNGYDAQAFPDSTDFAAIIAALPNTAGTGVVSGCAVTPKTPASMNVAVGAGSVRVNGTLKTAAAGTLALAAASTHDRRDIIYYPYVRAGANLGTLYVTTSSLTSNALMSTTSGTATSTPVQAYGTRVATYWYELPLGAQLSTTSAGTSTIGAFGTAHGALYNTAETGKAFVAGTWSITLHIKATPASMTMKSVHLRVGIKNGSTYTQLGSDLTLATVALTSTFATHTITGTLPQSSVLGATDRLYVEVWFQNAATTATRSIVLSKGGSHCPVVTPSGTVTSCGSVEGTPCAVAGWTRASSTPPPMKPAIPATSVLLAEVYVPGSATALAAKNIVDKRCIV